jgi:hypothetical protein
MDCVIDSWLVTIGWMALGGLLTFVVAVIHYSRQVSD